MSAHEVLYWFATYILHKRIDEAKALITLENARMESAAQNVIWVLCYMTTEDDPDLLQYFVDLGAPIILITQNYTTSLSAAALRDKPKMVRKLLDLGHPVNEKNSEDLTALGQIARNHIRRPLIASILLDFGGKCGAVLSYWVRDLCEFRVSVRSSAISTMGAMRAKYGKDVSRIIGRCVWSLRGIYE